MLRSIMLHAVWNDAAKGWVATSADVPGFVTGSDTFEQLHAKALPLIEELVDRNNVEFDGANIPVRIFAEIPTHVANPRPAA